MQSELCQHLKSTGMCFVNDFSHADVPVPQRLVAIVLMPDCRRILACEGQPLNPLEERDMRALQLLFGPSYGVSLFTQRDGRWYEKRLIEAQQEGVIL